MFTRKVFKEGLRLAAVLFCFVFPALIIWWLGGVGANIKESLLTAVVEALLLTPLSLAVAVIIAKVTIGWKELWKDLVLGTAGSLLFWLGFYGVFTTTRFSLIGKAAGIVGVVLTAVTMVLPRAREAVETIWK